MLQSPFPNREPAAQPPSTLYGLAAYPPQLSHVQKDGPVKLGIGQRQRVSHDADSSSHGARSPGRSHSSSQPPGETDCM